VIVPRPKEEVFKFFADAKNLNLLTPPWLHFQFATPLPATMEIGVRLAYRIRLHMIPIGWESEITVWNPPDEFCDIQIRGPYKKWIHSHTFETYGTGTVMTDHITYQVLGGFAVNWAFVSRDLKRVFDYRRDKILELFS
jgi:ligand-binding SRPBCC domain-containing protein